MNNACVYRTSSPTDRICLDKPSTSQKHNFVEESADDVIFIKEIKKCKKNISDSRLTHQNENSMTSTNINKLQNKSVTDENSLLPIENVITLDSKSNNNVVKIHKSNSLSVKKNKKKRITKFFY